MSYGRKWPPIILLLIIPLFPKHFDYYQNYVKYIICIYNNAIFCNSNAIIVFIAMSNIILRDIVLSNPSISWHKRACHGDLQKVLCITVSFSFIQNVSHAGYKNAINEAQCMLFLYDSKSYSVGLMGWDYGYIIDVRGICVYVYIYIYWLYMFVIIVSRWRQEKTA